MIEPRFANDDAPVGFCRIRGLGAAAVGAACAVAFVAAVPAAEPPDTNYDESKVPEYTLPDPLVLAGGAPVRDAAAWWALRRPEILALFERNIYGRIPSEAPPAFRVVVREESQGALDGRAVRRQVRIHLSDDDAGPRLDLLLYAPADRRPAPAFLGLNFYGNQTIHPDPAIFISDGWMRANDEAGVVDHRATGRSRGVYAARWQVEKVIARGYALVTLYYGDADPDNYRGDFTDGVHPLFYRDGQTAPAPDEWGAIGAWAWALSRTMDYLETEDLVDHRRVAVLGHSRLGKTALWAGARDQRFALVVSNNSGCGGAALFRRRFGERLDHMVRGPIGYWFAASAAAFADREAELPVDQHLLFALIAPRPVYVASAVDDRWADPRGEFLSALHAGPVYDLLGARGLGDVGFPPPDTPIGDGSIGYHVRTGEHDVTAYDWDQFLRFADRHLVPGG